MDTRQGDAPEGAVTLGSKKKIATTIEALNAASEVVDTAMGPVEFARHGEAPYVVVLHGTPGGHNQIFLSDAIEDAGFGIIAPSRPGYLRTPLETGPTFEEQGDAIACPLDVLEIDQAAVYAISGGGPCGIELAARHPKRVNALILEVAISTTYSTNVTTSAMEWMSSPAAGWLQSKLIQFFPRFVVNQLVKVASTLSDEERRRVTDDIVRDPTKLAVVRRFGDLLVPFEIVRLGWDNDLTHFRAIKRLPFDAVRCPTLVAHGTNDGDVLFINGETSASEIKDAVFHRAEKGFHSLDLSDGAEEYVVSERNSCANICISATVSGDKPYGPGTPFWGHTENLSRLPEHRKGTCRRAGILGYGLVRRPARRRTLVPPHCLHERYGRRKFFRAPQSGSQTLW